MCGIAGIVDWRKGLTQSEQGIIGTMLKKLRHRGPNAKHDCIGAGNKVALGTVRLSIVDIESGQQPLELEYGGAGYKLVFNGEIYNYRTIREELKALGHNFLTRCDTEVLLRSYVQWGRSCVEKFNGAFAFVILDEQKQELVLARDRTGIKPLYYTRIGEGKLIFASEPKALLEHPEISSHLDKETVAEYFLSSLVFTVGNASPERSFFNDIKCLPPATVAVFSPSGWFSDKYWTFPFSETETDAPGEDEIRSIIEEAVKLRLSEEVTYGIALSGGLDSSIVAAIAAKHSSSRVLASCIKFRGDSDRDNEDYRNAQVMAKTLGAKLVSPNLSPEELVGNVENLVRSFDHPHDNIRELAMYANYRTLSENGCKVVLAGEGADEMALGYYHSFPGFEIDTDAISSEEGFRPTWLSRVVNVRSLLTPEFSALIDFPALIDRVVSEQYDQCPSKDPIRRVQHLYCVRFLKHLQDSNDRCAMAHGIEPRFPFLDKNVIKLLLSLPIDRLISPETEKIALRQAFSGILPATIAERRKKPLPADNCLDTHRLIGRKLRKEMNDAPDEVWQILRHDVVQFRVGAFEKRIRQLGNQGGSEVREGSDLTAYHPMAGPLQIRTTQIFGLVTFLIWYRLNVQK